MLTSYAQQTLVDTLPIAAAVFTGQEYTISAVNTQMLDIWFKKPSVTGMKLSDVLPDICEQGFFALLNQVYTAGKEYHNADCKTQLMVDGQLKTKYFDFSFKPLIDAQGTIYGVVNTAVETTERTLSAQQLQQVNEELSAVNEEFQAANEELHSLHNQRDSLHRQLAVREERLRFAMSAARIGTWDLDIANNLVSWDDRCKELYGFSKNDIVPYAEVLRYMHPDDAPEVNEAVQYALTPASDGFYDVEFRTIGAEDGKLRWLHCSGKAFFDERGIAYRFSGIAQDITQQKQQEEALHLAHLKLKEKEEQLTTAKEAAQLGLFDWDLVNKVYKWDARFRQMYGMPEQDSFDDSQAAFTHLHPDDVPRIKAAVQLSQTYGKSNGAYDIEYRILPFAGNPERWVRAIGKTLFALDGTPVRFIGSVLDITEQKRQDQRRIDFIGIVSHELRSPLTSLNGYLQMLELNAKKKDDQFTGNIAAKARRQSDRMAGMITGFLDVARVGEGKIQIQSKPFDIADLIKAAEEESLATITSHKVIYHPVEHVMINADQDKIEQVLINFINNAVKYSPQGTSINVSAVEQDQYIRVCVKDEGMGIPAKDLPYIFDRFYRVDGEHLKSVKGFGIGLYLCREIIERHGGKLGVDSVVGAGSNFWFEIPVIC